MGNDDQEVQITAADVSAAIPLCTPMPERIGSRQVTTLEFSAVPSGGWMSRKLKGGESLSVSVDPSPVEGGAYMWSTQVRFGRKTDVREAFAKAGVEWPVWWAIGMGEITTLVEKIGLLTFSGFATPELALPWFVRVHAALAEIDPMTTIRMERSVKTPWVDHDDDFDAHSEIAEYVNEEMYSDAMKLEAYEQWQTREADWRRSLG